MPEDAFHLSADNWQQVQDLLAAALDQPPDARPAFLDATCPDLPGLRAEVESLLRAYADAEGFLDPLDDANTSALLAEGAALHTYPQVGPYQVLRELGRGGMGVVYLAERADGHFEQHVAVKLIKRGMDSDAIEQRFLHERQILARLQHPGVARLLDGGVSDDGQPYFAMEYIDGQPLTDYCDAHRLGINERLQLFAQAADAVQYAHQNLVVHRDLKPSNILVTPDGRLKLLDFGIAKLLGDTADDATRTSQRLLTPDYAAPEQVRGTSITTATDVYALGVVLYELLTGHRPHRFAERSAEAIAQAHDGAPPTKPSTVIGRPSEVRQPDGTTTTVSSQAISQARATEPDRLRRRLVGDLDGIVLKALRPEPAHRYASAEAFVADIRRHLAGLPVQAQQGTMRYRLVKFVRRHGMGVAASLLVVLSLVGGIITTTWQARQKAQEAAKATQVKDFTLSLFQTADPFAAPTRDAIHGDSITARVLLDRGVARVDAELANQPEVQAEMLAMLGNVYAQLGETASADPLLERALAIRQGTLGPRDLAVALSMSDLGTLRASQGRYAEADSLYSAALAIRQRRLGPNHLDVAASLNLLGTTADYLGDFASAEDYYRRALGIQRKALRRSDSTVATTLNNLAVLLAKQDLLDEAEPLYRDVLAIRQEALGEDHPFVSLSMGNLAGVLSDLSQFEEADSLFRVAIGKGRLLLGPEHDMVVHNMMGHGLLLRRWGRLEEAEATYRQVLDIRRRSLGASHPGVASVLNNLAALLRYRGDYAAASPIFEQVLAMDRAAFGDVHPYIADDLDLLGAVQAAQGDHAEALVLHREAATIHAQLWDEGHPRRASNMNRQAIALCGLGRCAAALPLADNALDSVRRALGDTHLNTAGIMESLAAIHLALGDVPKADSLYHAAWTVRHELLPESHADRALALVGLANVREVQGQVVVADSLLRAAYTLRQQGLPERHPLTETLRQRLAAR